MNDNDNANDEEMHAGLSILQREVLQAAVRELDDTPPPREVWQRIEAQAEAEGLLRGRYLETAKWLSGAAIAATVVLAVLNFSAPSAIDGAVAVNANSQFPTVPTSTPPVAGSPSNLNALMVQSQRLERDLRALPGQPNLVRAGTAATIAELEDRIAAIDYRLNHPAIRLSPVEAEIYWRQRVRLMNSLLNLRRAQAQRTAF